MNKIYKEVVGKLSDSARAALSRGFLPKRADREFRKLFSRASENLTKIAESEVQSQPGLFPRGYKYHFIWSVSPRFTADDFRDF